MVSRLGPAKRQEAAVLHRPASHADAINGFGRAREPTGAFPSDIVWPTRMQSAHHRCRPPGWLRATAATTEELGRWVPILAPHQRRIVHRPCSHLLETLGVGPEPIGSLALAWVVPLATAKAPAM